MNVHFSDGSSSEHDNLDAAFAFEKPGKTIVHYDDGGILKRRDGTLYPVEEKKVVAKLSRK